MNVACASCQTQYKIDASKVPASGGFIQCKTCGGRVRIPPPSGAANTDVTLAANAPSGSSPTATVPMPPANISAIPLAGSEPDNDVPTQVTVPPAGVTSLARGAAIPLAGIDAPAPVGAIFLNSDAPSTSVGAIPLGGSDPDDTKISAPFPTPLDADVTDPDANPAGAIPQSGPMAPAAGAILLGGPSAPLRAISGPYDDVPAPVSDNAPEVTRTGAGGPPLFLDNLPIAVDTTLAVDDGPDDLPMAAMEDVSVGDLFDDLPTPDNGPFRTSPVDTVSIQSGSSELGTFDDLPIASDAAPSLMDDLLDLDGDRETEVSSLDLDLDRQTEVSPLDSAAMSADIDGQGSAAAPHPSDVGPIQTGEHPTVPRSSAETQRKPNITLLVVLGGVLVVVVAAVVSTPFVGLQLWDPLGLAQSVEPQSGEPQPREPLPGKASQAQAKAKAKESAPSPEPQQASEPKVVMLSEANVDSLGYVDLREATTTYAASAAPNRGLLAWARYRLAVTYDDKQAREALIAAAPKKSEINKLEGREAAAAIGALVLSGKVQPARKLGEKLQRRFKNSPHLAYVLSTTFSKRPEIGKALKQLDRAKESGLIDVELRRGQLLLQGHNPDAGVMLLTKLAAASHEADLGVLIANILIENGRTEEIETVTAALTTAATLEDVAPVRSDLALQILIGSNLRLGDLDAAIANAVKRHKLSLQSANATIDLARLQQAAGQDGDATLKAAIGQATDATAAADLAAARVELALRKGDTALATKAFEEGDEVLSKKEARQKLAEGWIAKQNGQMAAAKKAFTAVARSKTLASRAHLEQALLSDTGGSLLKKLTELDKQGLADATYHLARTVKRRGNAKGAADLYGRLVVLGATVIDPIDLVLEWADTMALAGEPDLAQKQIEALRAKRPEDERIVAQMITMAARAGDTATVVNLHRALVEAKPADIDRKIRFAAALNDAGDFMQAQQFLDDLFKANKEARNAAALAQLGRAWVTREPFRAKELFNESLSLKENVGTYVLLGELEAGREKFKEAKKAFEKALSLNPQLTGAQIQLARVAIAEGSLPEAVKRLEKVLGKDPTNYDAILSLGDAYLGLSRPADSAVQYEIAVTLRPGNLDLLMKLALLQLQRLARTDEAITTLQKVITRDPERSVAYYHLGMAMKDNGNTVGAVTNLQKYLDLAPDGEWAPDAKKILDDLN